MAIILRNHKQFEGSVDLVYSCIRHTEKTLSRNLVKLVRDNNTYPCFHKITNEKFYDFMIETGKATKSFISHYDTIAKISTRKLLDLDLLYKYMEEKVENESDRNSAFAYLLALYIAKNEEACKELFFLLYNLDKVLRTKALFTVELEKPTTFATKFVLYKNDVNEDGTLRPTSAGLKYLKDITDRKIIIDNDTRDVLEGIIETQMNLCQDDDALAAFQEIIDLLGLEIEVL